MPEDSLFLECWESQRDSKAIVNFDYIRLPTGAQSYERLLPCASSLADVNWIKVTSPEVKDFQTCAYYSFQEGNIYIVFFLFQKLNFVDGYLES